MTHAQLNWNFIARLITLLNKAINIVLPLVYDINKTIVNKCQSKTEYGCYEPGRQKNILQLQLNCMLQKNLEKLQY